MANEHVRDRLLQNYSPSEQGTWKILGEDPNCDWGGAHSQPYLDTVTGTYVNVVEYAMSLKSFFTWGGGGSIVKQKTDIVNVDKAVDNSKRIVALEDEEAKLLARVEEIRIQKEWLK